MPMPMTMSLIALSLTLAGLIFGEPWLSGPGAGMAIATITYYASGDLQ